MIVLNISLNNKVNHAHLNIVICFRKATDISFQLAIIEVFFFSMKTKKIFDILVVILLIICLK